MSASPNTPEKVARREGAQNYSQRTYLYIYILFCSARVRDMIEAWPEMGFLCATLSKYSSSHGCPMSKFTLQLASVEWEIEENDKNFPVFWWLTCFPTPGAQGVVSNKYMAYLWGEKKTWWSFCPLGRRMLLSVFRSVSHHSSPLFFPVLGDTRFLVCPASYSFRQCPMLPVVTVL